MNTITTRSQFRLSKITSRLLFTLVFYGLFGAQTTEAQIIPGLGGERAGTTAGSFLKIGVGGRASAIGEAFVALANDVSALYWNPAGITQLKRNNVHFSHIEYVADVQHEFLGYVRRIGSFNAVGLSIVALHTDDMNVTTEVQPFGTGETFGFSDIMIGLTFAREFTDKFSTGVTVKYVREDLADVSMTGVLIDAGTLYKIGFRGARFAVSITNFGPEFETSGTVRDFLGAPREDVDFESFPAPLLLRVGFVFDLIKFENSRALLAFQLDHPNDESENFNYGAEYWFNDMIALRAGYKKVAEIGGISLGFGLDMSIESLNLQLDYSFSEFGVLGNLNRFSFNLSF
ncbi:PorV/PorQ family protein [candidate division KSB1 bacterium]|nr:PorV/PorQ family protein [candidate division KSB1 bacterium]NIR71814.1 PorV/PorQ family protein [candidate division KSB1 bacterium]NIS23488.1 PorV/PorQ family protein [candidate division KSB1 bacterium]NIT70410.1 PorV/PorQ family protein [candidate division KSB1 bacterium]NIU24113.1 PorV/PorQ family protein [candidate division KSB1 bacterium]